MSQIINQISNFPFLSVKPGTALSRCNRCNCVGPRTSGGPAPLGAPRHGIWVDYSFARYTLRLIIQQKRHINFIVNKESFRQD